MAPNPLVSLEKSSISNGLYVAEKNKTATTNLKDYDLATECPLVFRCIFKNNSEEWKLKDVSLKNNEYFKTNDSTFHQQLKYIKNKITLFNKYKNTSNSTSNANGKVLINGNSFVEQFTKDCYVRLMRFSLDDRDHISNVSVAKNRHKRPRSYEYAGKTIDEAPKSKVRKLLNKSDSWSEIQHSWDLYNVHKCEKIPQCKIEVENLTRRHLREHNNTVFDMYNSYNRDLRNSKKTVFHCDDVNTQHTTSLRSRISIPNIEDNVNDENSKDSCSSSEDSYKKDKWRIVKQSNGNGNRIVLMRETRAKETLLYSHKECEKLSEGKLEETGQSSHTTGDVNTQDTKSVEETKQNRECILGESFFLDLVTLLENEMKKYKIRENVEDEYKYRDMVKGCHVLISRSQLVEDLITNREMWKHDKDVIVDIPNAIMNKIGTNVKLRGRQLKRKHRKSCIPSISRKYIKYLSNKQTNESSSNTSQYEITKNNFNCQASDNLLQTDISSSINSPDCNIVEIDTNAILNLIDYSLKIQENGCANGKYKLKSFDFHLPDIHKSRVEEHKTVDILTKELNNDDRVQPPKENNNLKIVSHETLTESLSNITGKSECGELECVDINILDDGTLPKTLDSDTQKYMNIKPTMSQMFSHLDFNEISIDNSVPTEKPLPKNFFVYRKRSKRRKRNARKKSSKPIKDFVKITTMAIVHAIQDSEPRNNTCMLKDYQYSDAKDEEIATVSEHATKLDNENTKRDNDAFVEQNNNVFKKILANRDLTVTLNLTDETIESDSKCVTLGEQNNVNMLNTVVDKSAESPIIKECATLVNITKCEDICNVSNHNKYLTKRKKHRNVSEYKRKRRNYKSKYSTKDGNPGINLCNGIPRDISLQNNPISKGFVDSVKGNNVANLMSIQKLSDRESNISEDIVKQNTTGVNDSSKDKIHISVASQQNIGVVNTNNPIFKNELTIKKRRGRKGREKKIKIQKESNLQTIKDLKTNIREYTTQGNNIFPKENLEAGIKKEKESIVNLNVDIQVTENFTIRKLRSTEIISNAFVMKRNERKRNKINILKICTK